MFDVNYNNFNKICRLCFSNNGLKPIKDFDITDVLNIQLGLNFFVEDNLPHQICRNCVKKIQDIKNFTIFCKNNDETLKRCLNDYENEVVIKHEEIIIIENEETNESPPKVTNICDNLKLNRVTNPKTRIREKKHSCTTCNKTFINLSDLARHERSHTGEKPYQCVFCSKNFSSKQGLKAHVRVHSGEKPFRCDLCPKTFRISSNFSDHKKTHTGVRNYECKICFKKFGRSNTLKKHIFALHKTKTPEINQNNQTND